MQFFGGKSDDAKFGSRSRTAEAAYHTAIMDWRDRIGIKEFLTAKSDLAALKNRHAHLKTEMDHKLAEVERNRRAAQLDRYLSQFTITRAKIRGIGDGRKATLASYGIDTAADVTTARVLLVPGFGGSMASTMVEWRQKLERRFQFSATPTPADLQASEQVKRNYAVEAGKMRAKLKIGPAELATAAATIKARLSTPDPYVQKAYQEWQQLRTDLEYLGLSLPMPRPIPAAVVAPTAALKVIGVRISAGGRPASPTPPSQGSFSPSCPRCGISMVRRQNRSRGTYFWGCSRYPNCKGTRPS